MKMVKENLKLYFGNRANNEKIETITFKTSNMTFIT